MEMKPTTTPTSPTAMTNHRRNITAREAKRAPLATAAALCLAACCASLSDAFTLPTYIHTRAMTRYQWALSRPTCRLGTRARAQTAVARDDGLSMAAGQGFGTSVPEAGAEVEPTKGSGQTRAVSGSGLVSWEKEYKAYIKRTGKYLCSMSWEGHEEMGRGAIFANYDDARAEGKLNDAEKFGGIPSMYIPLKEFESMRAADRPGEEDDLAQIMHRVQTYRPETEFVVVFQAAGVMGTDIVRPNIPPPEMAKHVVKQDKASAAEVSVGADGVIDVTAIED